MHHKPIPYLANIDSIVYELHRRQYRTQKRQTNQTFAEIYQIFKPIALPTPNSSKTRNTKSRKGGKNAMFNFPFFAQFFANNVRNVSTSVTDIQALIASPCKSSPRRGEKFPILLSKVKKREREKERGDCVSRVHVHTFALCQRFLECLCTYLRILLPPSTPKVSQTVQIQRDRVV